MPNTIVFDAFNGVSGDMILGALIDLGMPVEHLEKELKCLDLTGFRLSAERVERQGLSGINFQVESESTSAHHHHHHHEEEKGGGHSHARHEAGHDSHRTWRRIRRLIEDSRLTAETRERALSIFARLAEAEARVHRTSVEDVHFHEVGALDSIVDIVGACIGFEYFDIREFYASPLNLGGGTVTFSHGTWPVPAPATAELVRGFPVRLSGIEAELTTPTGAAVVTTLVAPDRMIPDLRIAGSGFGAGDREIAGIPNMLRLMLGERACDSGARPSPPRDLKGEKTVLLEANIDDMEAELFGYVMESALERGALDVFFTPIQMKKNRPGLLLSVLCRPEDRDRLADLVFRETTTLGLRVAEVDRWVIDRQSVDIETRFGRVKCKISRYGERRVTASPEYEELRRLARETGLPMREIRLRVMRDIAEPEP
jgi:pyridinium-3,5-bisthiocarboxylic acid mononucleotide nickel chelatase